MRRTPAVATLLLAAALLPSCLGPAGGAALADFPAAPPRPRDPWVLRCVLDKQPRRLVIALSDDLWLAYDTTTCTLAKAWHGDVNFDGPVYTTMHGPQPTTRGEDLHDPLAQSRWIAWHEGDPDLMSVPFRDMPAPIAHFGGYRIVQGHVQLEYTLSGPDGFDVHVTETIEAAPAASAAKPALPEGWQLVPPVDLWRRFDVDALPAGWTPELFALPWLQRDAFASPASVTGADFASVDLSDFRKRGRAGESPPPPKLIGTTLRLSERTAVLRVLLGNFPVRTDAAPEIFTEPLIATPGAARSDGDPQR